MLLAVALVALTQVQAPAAAEENGDANLFNKAEAAQVSQRLHGEPRLLRSFDACPADTFERERPFWRRFAEAARPSERACARRPAKCYDLCVSWSNAPACFDLAQAFEHHSLDVDDVLDKERFYALACAGGFPAGCTNRAAGIRNGGYAEDPFHDVPLATKQACEYRSFLIDCDRRGAWGCAMLGQAYRNGEGVAAQAERARAAFETACEINPKFAACAFAKGYLDKMVRPGQPTADDAGSDDD